MKEVRSLDRGLALMEVLARDGARSLAQLHGETGLPKSTIRRLLATLQARRIVRRSLWDGQYRINIVLPVTTGDPLPPEVAEAVDIVLAVAMDLTRAVGWPSDIHIPDGIAMRIVESTRSVSPFQLYRGEVNRRVPLFASAAGLSHLAHLRPAQVAALARLSDTEPRWSPRRFGLTPAGLDAELARVRARGYATRLTGYVGEGAHSDDLHAIAVPLWRNADARGRPWGALTLLWPRAHRPVASFAAEFLAPLQAAAARASAELAGPGAP
ncbi:MAG: helix-turn-helix domain-containing protein [Sneathiellaceae bacterium]